MLSTKMHSALIDGVIDRLKGPVPMPAFFRQAVRAAASRMSFTSNMDAGQISCRWWSGPRNISWPAILSRWCCPSAFMPRPKLTPLVTLPGPAPYQPEPLPLFSANWASLIQIGSSPEILVRKDGKTIELRPIAGTRKRGPTPEEDQALEKELLADPKERAEHLMLVDLGRNDVGRVAKGGSVEVRDLLVDRTLQPCHAYRLGGAWR